MHGKIGFFNNSHYSQGEGHTRGPTLTPSGIKLCVEKKIRLNVFYRTFPEF